MFYVLENALAQAVAVTGAGTLFQWDSPPIIDDAGDWSLGAPPPTPNVVCNRAGRYGFHYAIAGAFGGADPPAYIGSYADLAALYLNPSLCQWDVQGANQAVTFHMFFVLPAVALGDVFRLWLLSFPNVLGFNAGAGATLTIERLA